MDDDAPNSTDVTEIMASLAGMRHVIARLLAYEAMRTPNPSAVLRDVSGANFTALSNVEGGTEAGAQPGFILLREQVQSEVDSIVVMAKGMLRSLASG